MSKLAANELSVPRFHQLIVLATLLMAGVMLGQLVRRVRHAAGDFAQRVQQELT
jgi:hypothetical protein